MPPGSGVPVGTPLRGNGLRGRYQGQTIRLAVVLVSLYSGTTWVASAYAPTFREPVRYSAQKTSGTAREPAGCGRTPPRLPMVQEPCARRRSRRRCIGNEGLLAAAAGVPAIVESAGARFAWEELFAGQIRHGHTCLAYERCGRALSRLAVRARAGVEDYYPTRPRSHGVKLMFEVTSARGIYIPRG